MNSYASRVQLGLSSEINCYRKTLKSSFGLLAALGMHCSKACRGQGFARELADENEALWPLANLTRFAWSQAVGQR